MMLPRPGCGHADFLPRGQCGSQCPSSQASLDGSTPSPERACVSRRPTPGLEMSAKQEQRRAPLLSVTNRIYSKWYPPSPPPKVLQVTHGFIHNPVP